MYKTFYFLEAAGDPFRADAAQTANAQMPRAAGITLTRALAEQIDPAAPAKFAGALELWHFSAADALAHSERATLEKLLAPGARIAAVVTGLARTVMRTADHYGSHGMKCVLPFRRKEGMSVEAFQRRWWHGHGPIAARTENALFYLQTHPLAETYLISDPAFDGVTELHWRDLVTARAAMKSRQMREDQGNDSPHFARAGSVLMFAAQEEIVREP